MKNLSSGIRKNIKIRIFLKGFWGVVIWKMIKCVKNMYKNVLFNRLNKGE